MRAWKKPSSIEPMLWLGNLDLPFEFQTNALDKALGGVLVQEGHPMAFEECGAMILHLWKENDGCNSSFTAVKTLLTWKYIHSGH